jgi:VanZ family protein
MLLPLRHPRFWLVLGWFFVVAATVSSLVPVQKLPLPSGINDKFEHVTGYALLTLWFTGIYPRSRYFVIAFSLLAMGVLIELAQGAMHVGREADVRDVVANCAGIGVGLMLASLWLGGWAQRVEGWARRT